MNGFLGSREVTWDKYLFWLLHKESGFHIAMHEQVFSESLLLWRRVAYRNDSFPSQFLHLLFTKVEEDQFMRTFFPLALKVSQCGKLPVPGTPSWVNILPITQIKKPWDWETESFALASGRHQPFLPVAFFWYADHTPCLQSQQIEYWNILLIWIHTHKPQKKKKMSRCYCKSGIN